MKINLFFNLHTLCHSVDFFRTMEDASAEDLDWFWRGWFYGIDPVDIAIEKVTVAKADTDAQSSQSSVSLKVAKADTPAFDDISKIRNREDKNFTFYTDKDKEAQDFYWRYDRGMEKVDANETFEVKSPAMENLTGKDKEQFKNTYAYQVDFANKGGLLMPLIVEFTFEDASKTTDRTSAQIWRHNEQKVSKTYYFNKKVKSIQLDPMLETADIDTSNNYWGSIPEASKFSIFKARQNQARGAASGVMNPMQAVKK